MMSNKLNTFKGFKDLAWGIQRRIIDIETSKKLFNELNDKNKFYIDKPLNVGTLKLLTEQYVSPREDMFNEIQINNILKNNFDNGSYILEFFDEDKFDVKFLLDDPKMLLDFNEMVNELLPINISNVSDRLGNVIFQFPINKFDLHIDTIKYISLNQFIGIKIEIHPKDLEYDLSNLIIRMYEHNDNVITRQKYIEVKQKITKIQLDDCFGTHIEIIDKKNSLAIYRYKLNIMKQMNTNMQLIEPQKRVFEIKGKVYKVEVSHNASNNILGKETNKPFDEWIRDRKYEQELKELEHTKSFIQYYGNEKEKALKDVRELINRHGDKGVYIWDPYLSEEDIKNTLYYCKHSYVPLKGISGLEQASIRLRDFFNSTCFSIVDKYKNNYIYLDFQYKLNIFKKLTKKEKSKYDMIENLEKDNEEFLLMNLEVRGKVSKFGYNFHDRFLIFPQEKAKVWSLGISVNQLGESHHILQEVKNAQHILNAFNRLWDELNHKECLVWKSK